ncbi:ABC transporter ATP-binding protein [Microvirga roseola]|uniref:ABC transporter ATP-binding protein n=1 Tax=Microvirga roseola TaxID=2883126 RepID=UPI001E4EDA6F|nr:ABC transporter ATP-binding protein [Microvirga roseola]
MSSVSLECLVKSYGPTEVVKGINLHIEEGELIVFLGPSGCGKTTTLRMIAGFIDPTSGAIRIGGEPVVRKPPRARNLGMVFQDYALFPNMSVADNVGFGLVERGKSRDVVHKRVEQMLRLIHMEALGNRYPIELSGGQQQRVALARALAYEPRVLLMDEPLGALDQKLREEMQREFARIQRDVGITTIFVTHDQQEAMALADRIIVMNGGVIEQAGRPEELYDRPDTLFIADFIGRSNRFEGKVVRKVSDLVSVRLSGGEVITGQSRSVLSVGDPAACVVRPESLAVGATPQEGTNAISAQVLRRSFFGSGINTILRYGENLEVILQTPKGADLNLQEGNMADVRFRPEDTFCFPLPKAGR